MREKRDNPKNANNIPCMNADDLKKLNKNKKLIKKLAKVIFLH